LLAGTCQAQCPIQWALTVWRNLGDCRKECRLSYRAASRVGRVFFQARAGGARAKWTLLARGPQQPGSRKSRLTGTARGEDGDGSARTEGFETGRGQY
jgi:hypothetical protein